jgi:phosphoglycerate-specific signal transduction histidine kinase
MEKAIPVDNLIAAHVVNGKASKFLIEEINWHFEFYNNMTSLLQLFFWGVGSCLLTMLMSIKIKT